MEPSAAQLFSQLAAQGAMIERLTADSRRCAPGSVFFAYPGEAADGRAYIGEAIARGASGVFWEERDFSWRPEWRAPNRPVKNLKSRAGGLASHFHGAPSASLWMCGVTGTNGKTSCSQWIATCLTRKGIRTGVIGTLGAGFPGALDPATNTTPDALVLHGLLKDLLHRKAAAVAMEVSSHGLAQGRVNAVEFDCALFTNLSHDHLDYHRTMEEYECAKGMLFDMPGLGAAVINLDDEAGARLAGRLAGRVRVIGYGFDRFPVTRVDEYLTPSVLDKIDTGQVGRFNVANTLGVLGCLLAYGMQAGEAAGLMARLPAVPGRMEKIGERPLVVVDYAHTPDALEKVLAALRPAAEKRRGKLAVVFGAGGDRDPAKRPAMGEVAARLADVVLVTSDNPRNEDPLSIISQIGLKEFEVDRARAIEKAILESAPDDVVLIAGKGHETYQEIAGRRLPFSDAEAARAALAKRGKA